MLLFCSCMCVSGMKSDWGGCRCPVHTWRSSWTGRLADETITAGVAVIRRLATASSGPPYVDNIFVSLWCETKMLNQHLLRLIRDNSRGKANCINWFKSNACVSSKCRISVLIGFNYANAIRLVDHGMVYFCGIFRVVFCSIYNHLIDVNYQ